MKLSIKVRNVKIGVTEGIDSFQADHTNQKPQKGTSNNEFYSQQV
jgi:hypothetical protein